MSNSAVNLKITQLRRIRSFVRRGSRLTTSQRNALFNQWPSIGINYQSHQLNIDTLFNKKAPIILEIGFGMGQSLVSMAASYPEFNFIGIEVYLPGIGSCIVKAIKANISNLRLIYYDAIDVLEHMIPDMSISKVQLFFPDPWQKKRQNKRRIIQKPFIDLVSSKLVKFGLLHVVTDWQPYAAHILTIMSAYNSFNSVYAVEDCTIQHIKRPITKFEKRSQKLGHKVSELIFRKEI